MQLMSLWLMKMFPLKWLRGLNIKLNAVSSRCCVQQP
jgi:hypothetical protein